MCHFQIIFKNGKNFFNYKIFENKNIEIKLQEDIRYQSQIKRKIQYKKQKKLGVKYREVRYKIQKNLI